MTFQHFVDAVRSAWGAVNNATIFAALFVSCGINLVFPSVPGPAAVLACLLCYLAGFLVSCYKVAERAPELASKDARIVELEKRPTQEDVNELVRAHAEDLAARDAEIAEAVASATKPLQEQIDRLMNREHFALMRLRGLSLKELGIIKEFMTQSGEVMLKVGDASVKKLAESGAIRINTDTYSPPDLYPFTLDDSLRSLLVEFPDTLEKAVKEAEAVKSSYSNA